jgi:hypothetical protein
MDNSGTLWVRSIDKKRIIQAVDVYVQMSSYDANRYAIVVTSAANTVLIQNYSTKEYAFGVYDQIMAKVLSGGGLYQLPNTNNC